METFELTIVERAITFAVRAHAGQRRKLSRAPYVVHPVEVLHRAAHLGVGDEELLAAAALHDVVEDTAIGLDTIADEFGPRVAALVGELTYDASVDDSKDAYMAAFAERSVEALVLKLCDRAANVDDYRRSRPDYAPTYAAKAARLYDAVDARLAEIERTFDAGLAARAAAESRRLRALASRA